MSQAIRNFAIERLVPFFEFRKVRLHRHSICLLNQSVGSPDLSLAQTRYKSEATPEPGFPQSEPEAIGMLMVSEALNALVENVIIVPLPASGNGLMKQ